MISTPMPDTLTIAMYSSFDGFFVDLKTLLDSIMKSLNFSHRDIKFLRKSGL